MTADDRRLKQVEELLLLRCLEVLGGVSVSTDDLRKVHAIYKQLISSRRVDDGHDDSIDDLDLPFPAKP